jgi:hypothetical protein
MKGDETLKSFEQRYRTIVRLDPLFDFMTASAGRFFPPGEYIT